jgi:hypothetical protein
MVCRARCRDFLHKAKIAVSIFDYRKKSPWPPKCEIRYPLFSSTDQTRPHEKDGVCRRTTPSGQNNPGMVANTRALKHPFLLGFALTCGALGFYFLEDASVNPSQS